MPDNVPASPLRVPLAGFLAWVLPGLGHLFLGDRSRALIFFVTITGTFWTGVAVGGVVDTVDPQKHKLWFTAQICTGTNALAAVRLHNTVVRNHSPESGPISTSFWGSVDVGIHYAGVAGLLNLLVILDAISRADPVWARRRGGASP